MDLKPLVHLQLSKEAQQLLELLINLGYLSGKNQELLYQRLLQLRNSSGTLELDEVRRCAAEILFESFDSLPKRMQRYLKSDWKLLFS